MAIKERKRISTSKKVLDLREIEHVGSGSYGAYYQLSDKKGVKLLENGARLEALAEWNILVALSKITINGRRITPKAYSIERFNVLDEDGDAMTMIGLVMEHIEEDDDAEYINTHEVIEQANTTFALQGIIYHDFNSENVLQTEKGPRIIDFTPGFVSVLKKNRKGQYIVDGYALQGLPSDFGADELDIRGQTGNDWNNSDDPCSEPES